ncbi:MAG: branched-chain amino acid ABC transporter permease/ATP-binding protein [Acidimicrobiales bacterium]
MILAAAALSADVCVHGVLLGLVYGLLAVGLVLVYRASGVVNFAYGETGALGAAVLAKLVLDGGWSWYAALPVALAAGALIGGATYLLVARRLEGRPKVALLVATIGLSQVLLVGQLLLPRISTIAPFPSPIHRHLILGSVRIGGPDFAAVAAVPALVVGLAVWLGRTPSGRGLKAAGDNRDAALLAGIPTRRIAVLAWAVAGALATATAVLANPLQGVIVGRPTEALGAGLLVRALAAGLVGRLRSLPVALGAGIGIGVIQAIADAGSSDPSSADAGLLLVVLVALYLLHRHDGAASAEAGDGELVRVPPVAPRAGRRPAASAVCVLVIVVAVSLPSLAGRSSQMFFLSRLAIYALVGLSLVVLTGWTGQVSLGQFALVGVGTFGAARLQGWGAPFWTTVPLVAVIGAAAALVIGLPALRAKGLELAVATLALAVACRSWVFTRHAVVGTAGAVTVHRGRLLGVDLRGPVAYFEACLLLFAVAAWGVWAIRRRPLGRALLAVRSNEARAATIGISPARTKLTAFALAGAMAAVAGALLAGLRIRSGGADFGPEESLRILAVAVIGGAGSVAGIVAGAVVVLGVPAVFGDTTIAGLLPSGIGLLVLVLVAPGGLAESATRARHALRRGPDSGAGAGESETGDAGAQGPVAPRLLRSRGAAALQLDGIRVAYGGRVALDSVTLRVDAGEVVGLIGGNGAGKTTLLDVISGFVVPTAGTVGVDGRNMTTWTADRRARAGLGRVLQDARLFDDLTLAEAVAAAAPADPDRVASTLSLLGLTALGATPCQQLSTGLRRLGELACAIVRQPSILLLDEPTAGLAQREAEAFSPLLRALARDLGATVVLVEHDVPLVAGVADRMVCLGAGRIIADGLPDAVLADPDVVASFLGGNAVSIARSDGGDPG